MPAEIDPLEILHRHYLQPRIRRGKQRNYLSPSRLVYCPRQCFVYAFGYEDSPQITTFKNLDYGTARHRSLQELFMSEGYLKEIEHLLETFEPIHLFGYADGITYDDRILEIKTTRKPIDEIKSPMRYHVDQLQLYLYMSGMEEGVLLYESKEIPDDYSDIWKSFVVKRDEENIRRMLDLGERICWHIRNRKLPECSSYCQYFGCSNPACSNRNIWKSEGWEDPEAF